MYDLERGLRDAVRRAQLEKLRGTIDQATLNALQQSEQDAVGAATGPGGDASTVPAATRTRLIVARRAALAAGLIAPSSATSPGERAEYEAAAAACVAVQS